jgi:hypothetical protein
MEEGVVTTRGFFRREKIETLPQDPILHDTSTIRRFESG